jgi:hypothetical protein
MSNAEHYQEIFDYVSLAEPPIESTGVVMFGRDDHRLAETAGLLASEGMINFMIVSGGFGKDSGRSKCPEAYRIADDLLALEPPIKMANMYYEPFAATGEQNAKYSIELMNLMRLPYQNAITTIAHATSSRRLSEQLRHEAIKRGTPIQNIYRVPTNYPFDAEKPSDQNEARAELLRLADWPRFGWLQKQVDLPEELVDFARSQHGDPHWRLEHAKARLFGALPQSLQKRIASML